MKKATTPKDQPSLVIDNTVVKVTLEAKAAAEAYKKSLQKLAKS